MTLTSIQLSPTAGAAGVAIALLHGSPVRTTSGARGPIASFRPGAVVAVALTTARATQVDVFRTLEGPSRGSLLPYVSRPVRMLVSAWRSVSARRLRALLTLAAAEGLDHRPDSFFLHLVPLLSARSGRPLTLPTSEDA